MPLGCATHQAYLYDRGGMQRIGQITPLTRLRWTRIRDDVSNAVAFTAGPDPECCELLRDAECGRHEMVIFRDGKRVWEGPLTRIAYSRDSIEVEARDVMHYVYRTIVKGCYNNRYPNLAYTIDRAAQIMRAELARKEALVPPINVVPYIETHTKTDSSRTSRLTLPYQKTVYEDVDDMAAKSGMDYTVVGRRIVLWDTHDSIGQTQTMTEDDFIGNIVVTAYGMELATYSAVTDGEGSWAAVGGEDEYYGLQEILATVYDEPTDTTERAEDDPEFEGEQVSLEDMTTEARANMGGRFPTPVVVRVPDGSQVNPQTLALTIDHLVAGVWIPLRATLTCRTVSQMQKLDKLEVSEDGNGEIVLVTMSPAPGQTPWDESSGETSAS